MNLGKENPAVINDIQSEEVQATSCNPTQEISMENESLSNTSNKTKKKKKKGNLFIKIISSQEELGKRHTNLYKTVALED